MHYVKKGTAYLVVLDRGEDVLETLTKFLEEQGITGGQIHGIGALKDNVLGYFSLEKKDYQKFEVEDSCELINFHGNISLVDGKPFIHAHAVLCPPNFEVRGGHYFSGTVSVTGEFYVYPFEHKVERAFDDEVKLNLIKLD